MKKLFAYRTCIRLFSLSVLVVPICVDWFFGDSPLADGTPAVCALAAAAVLICPPLTKDVSCRSVLRYLYILPALALMAVFRFGVYIDVLILGVGVMAHATLWGINRFSNVRSLFGSAAVWNGVEDFVAMYYISVYQSVACLCVAIVVRGISPWLSALPAVLLCILLYVKDYMGYTVFLTLKKERKIKEMIKVTLQSELKTDDEHELARMKVLYDRCVSIMESQRPYLDPEFSLDACSLLVYTNKVYLSRTVNSFSGRNFRQFVNHYRIQYALDLLAKNPRLKVAELSDMCGFNTSVSFSMAFKINVGETPSDYIRKMDPGSLSSQ